MVIKEQVSLGFGKVEQQSSGKFSWVVLVAEGGGGDVGASGRLVNLKVGLGKELLQPTTFGPVDGGGV